MELWRHGAGELARAIAAGDVSAREAVDSNLARIEAVNGKVNAGPLAAWFAPATVVAQ